MSVYNFGIPISRTFIAYQDQSPIQLPTQEPTIYLFDRCPDVGVAASGVGAIQTVTSWSEPTDTPYKRTYSLSAINYVASVNSVVESYWEAINFILVTSGVVHTVVRSFDVEKTEQGDSYPDLDSVTIIAFFPAIISYVSQAQIDSMFDVVLLQVKQDFKAKGIKWSRLFELNDLKLAIAYKTIAMINLGQIKDINDRFAIKYKEFSGMYEAAIEAVNLPLDTDGDGKADEKTTEKLDYVIARR